MWVGNVHLNALNSKVNCSIVYYTCVNPKATNFYDWSHSIENN